MKRFFLKSVIFISGLIIVIVSVALTNNRKVDIETDYMAAIIDKHKRAEQFDSNRLLLVSGSSLAFGVNSETLEKEFNVNVVNFALQAGLGFDFIINEAMATVKKGDVILLGLEYPLYDDDNKPNIDLVYHTQNLYPQSKAFYQLSVKDNIFIQIQKFRDTFKKRSKEVNLVYNRKSFNKYGDVISHLNNSKKYISGNVVLNQMTINKSINSINKLYLRCKAIGAELYIMFPCYPEKDYEKHAAIINNIKQQLLSKNIHVKIINDPATFVFNEKYFFDTEYHLNGEGRKLMTQKLVEILRMNVFYNKKNKILVGSI